MWTQILSGSTLFVKEVSKCFSRQQNIRLFMKCALRVDTCIYGQYFHEMDARLRGSKSFTKLYIKKISDCPSLADEIAEPRSDIDIKNVPPLQ